MPPDARSFCGYQQLPASAATGQSRRYAPGSLRFSRWRRAGYFPIIQFVGPSSLRMTQNHSHSTTPAQPHQHQGGEFARSPQRQGTTAAPSARSENASPQIVHLSIMGPPARSSAASGARRGSHLGQQQLGPREDARERVVEVVGHFAGHLAEGAQALLPDRLVVGSHQLVEDRPDLAEGSLMPGLGVLRIHRFGFEGHGMRFTRPRAVVLDALRRGESWARG